MYIVTLNAQSLGLMMGCLFADPTAALAAVSALVIPLIILCGFFVDLSSVPAWFSWLQYISPFKYGFELLTVNEFAGLPIECTDDIIICPVENGDQVLEYLGLSYANIWTSVFAILLLTVVWHLTAYGYLHFAYVAPVGTMPLEPRTGH